MQPKVDLLQNFASASRTSHEDTWAGMNTNTLDSPAGTGQDIAVTLNITVLFPGFVAGLDRRNAALAPWIAVAARRLSLCSRSLCLPVLPPFTPFLIANLLFFISQHLLNHPGDFPSVPRIHTCAPNQKCS